VSKIKDLTGARFFSYVVVSRAADCPTYGVSWVCQCDCGNEKIFTANHLRISKNKNSPPGCECISREKAFNSLYYKIKYRAEKERTPVRFDLSKDDVRALIKQPCHYCGSQPKTVWPLWARKAEQIVYQGIDRLENDNGYFQENVVPCCAACNRAKNTMGEKEFRDMVSRIYHHWIKGEV
jgi:hypothetical protein